MINGPAANVHPWVVYGPKSLGAKFVSRFSNLKCAAASVVWHGKYYWCHLEGAGSYQPEEYTYEECSRLLLGSKAPHDTYKTLVNRSENHVRSTDE